MEHEKYSSLASFLGSCGVDREGLTQWLDIASRERFARAHFRDRNGAPWQVRPYQRPSLESRALRKVHCDGRDVGKTAEIEIIACWAMVACPDREMLIATQCENHLFPLMNRLARRFQQTPAFTPSLVEMRRSPSWHFRFSNNFVLWGRIAGPRGMNFQGMHVDWQIVDEAQEMTESGWGELYQALNGGGRRWVYGVPNGLRNSFYRMTCQPDAEHYNWSSRENPEFTDEKDQELIRLYGGRNSPGYIHRVLGQHGEPSHAVFSLDEYLSCVDSSRPCCSFSLQEGDSFEAPEGIAPGRFYLGCDLGYARDPSEFVVYRDAPPWLIQECRVHLEKVNYKRQEEIIVELDRAYRFSAIGIDAGNSGRAVAHMLMSRGQDWCARVHALEFGAMVDLHLMPDGRRARRRAKEFMTELIQRRLSERTLIFPPDPDREAQYAAHTYSVNAQGQIVYEKGDDHLIDADRCALFCHYLDQREPEPAFRSSLPPEVLLF
ncbi:MAG TPA: hypothetical protein PK491_13615 [Candidatus Hydrogenedentes bacterium]|nr:hypothetical protein [Candidatus Hydrogenedentota bacterium]